MCGRCARGSYTKIFELREQIGASCSSPIKFSSWPQQVISSQVCYRRIVQKIQHRRYIGISCYQQDSITFLTMEYLKRMRLTLRPLLRSKRERRESSIHMVRKNVSSLQKLYSYRLNSLHQNIWLKIRPEDLAWRLLCRRSSYNCYSIKAYIISQPLCRQDIVFFFFL